MRVVMLVPRRADNGRRDRLWRFVKGRADREHPHVEIFEGHHDDGPFNRSAAVNAAADVAGEWDVAVIADSDSFVSPSQLDRAVAEAERSGRIVFAFDRFAYLSRQMSDMVMAGSNGDWWPGVEWSMDNTCSSQVVVPRRLWDAVGGFDEGFVGWGMEDVAFSLACQALGGGMGRIPGEVWHLYHSTAQHEASPNYQANVDRMKLYADCDYNPERMRALLAELGVTWSPAA